MMEFITHWDEKNTNWKREPLSTSNKPTTPQHLPPTFTYENLPPAREGTIACVDGGSAVIFKSASKAIALVRIYSRGTQRSRIDELVTATLEGKNITVQGTTTITLSARRGTDDEETLTNSINAYRKLRELETALELSTQHYDLLLIDGSLDAKTGTTDERELLDKLMTACEQQGTILVGFCKSCSWTHEGQPLTSTLAQRTNNQTWSVRWHTSHIAKLHPKAPTPFRIDIKGNKEQEKKALSILRWASRDIATPGYPYALSDADKFAQIPNKEATILSTLYHARNNWATELEQNSVAYHDVLNKIG